MGFPSFYPFVQLILRPAEYARAPFPDSGPSGVTVHYTADGSVEQALRSFAEQGFCYHLIIDREGKVTQACFMDRTVWHAGKASWLGKSPNAAHIAIAVVSWGAVAKDKKGVWRSYAGTEIPAAEVAHRPNNVNGKLEYWHACTDKQEAMLEDVLRWCMAHGIDAADICGHDEAALPLGRKNDPGGTLTWSMAGLRERLLKK